MQGRQETALIKLPSFKEAEPISDPDKSQGKVAFELGPEDGGLEVMEVENHRW